ncbi:Histidine phosphatase superfamily clade-2 [Penicillium cosmopolitanum]|uniref:Histidine phosphatase superfamily clade-2 n=1 Tax=Penicillium cosmopolitanum TaxID=1131564 RepID=A0A9X0BB15_9EURO|nr:Histidine phosphatase superfamily clade-2 [Penicillium cosmopolitanum]KAJ5398282.1 Histidine phosphatase superfamily clade-2 [Penicillium cosmopolitanum]
MRASFQSGLLLASLSAPFVDAERVLGAYIYSRHGDRTPKVFGNTALTVLGYREVFNSGSYYNGRYIAEDDSTFHIQGISNSTVKAKQISVTAPDDSVLQNSATGFMQGVYPPTSQNVDTLSNKTKQEAPLGGYQIVTVGTTDANADSEGSTWLQGSSGCSKATVSSSSYYTSQEYLDLEASTKDFYQSLAPVLKGAFAEKDMTFKNAYTIFDYLNVGRIHNETKPNVTDAQWIQLQSLANNQQFNLAYNSSEADGVRAIDGKVLAGEILSSLNDTVTGDGKFKLGVQFGSYGTFFSWFGIMQMPAASVNFTGVVDYASTFAIELVTDESGTDFPSSDKINVRFMFHNGTVSDSSEPTIYPMFGLPESEKVISWSKFVSETEKVAVTTDTEWCDICGNTDGKCASSGSTDSTSTSSTSSGGSSGGVSRPVAGVIGAMVTLAVILGLGALFFLVGGFTVAKRRKGGPEMSNATAVTGDKKA